MISFDLKSLFTNVPLKEIVNVALDRIYHQKEINTSIRKTTFVIFCYYAPKNVYFCFGGDMYQWKDGVVMGFPLGPIQAGIFKVEFETRIITMFRDSISH